MTSARRTLLTLHASVGLVAAALFIFATALGDDGLRLAAKPFPVLAMIGAVLLCRRDRYARTIAAGLGFCVVGDLLLEFPDTLFLPGMIAFLIGHIAYIAAFVREARELRPALAVPFAVWVGWALVHLWPTLGEMLIPVTAYTLVIFAMMWRAAAYTASRTGGYALGAAAMLGAVLFGFSDTLIALDRFGEPLEGVRIPIIVTYWLGQLAIAASAMRGGSHGAS